MLVERAELNREASGHERRQLPLPDRDPPAHRARHRRRAATGCSTRCGCTPRRRRSGTTLEDELDAAARHPHHRRPDGRRDAARSCGCCTTSSEIEDEAGLETHVLGGRRAARVRAVPRRRPARGDVLPGRGPREPVARRAALRAARGSSAAPRPHAGGGDAIESTPRRRAPLHRHDRRGQIRGAPASSTPPAPGRTSSPR